MAQNNWTSLWVVRNQHKRKKKKHKGGERVGPDGLLVTRMLAEREETEDHQQKSGIPCGGETKCFTHRIDMRTLDLCVAVVLFFLQGCAACGVRLRFSTTSLCISSIKLDSFSLTAGLGSFEADRVCGEGSLVGRERGVGEGELLRPSVGEPKEVVLETSEGVMV